MSAPRRWAEEWWRGGGGLTGAALRVLLAPAEWLFRGAVTLRSRAYAVGLLRARAAGVPVISVGNIVVGGAGKTPFTAALARLLREAGAKPGIALRGYGEDEVRVHREINPDVPVFAAPRRIVAAQRAAESGCDVVLLDDGFQHRALARDLDIVLVSADAWSGGRVRLLPVGPYREPLGALRRAHLIVVTAKVVGETKTRAVVAALRALPGAPPVVSCRILATELRSLWGDEARPLGWLRGRVVAAVSSLADPAPFLASLRAAGAHIMALSYPDHHAFNRRDASEVERAAGSRTLVMTRKEAVKLRDLLARGRDAWLLDQRVELGADEETVRRAVLSAAQRSAAP